MREQRIKGTTEAWESGDLGKSEAHVRRVGQALERQIDEAMNLQAISIRLPKGLIETFKLLASLHGVGYQPLMRDALERFAESEMKQVLRSAVAGQRKPVVKDEGPPAPGRRAA